MHRWRMRKLNTLILAAAITVFVTSCGHKISEEEQRVRDIATKYRDSYVDGLSAFGSTEVITNLTRGTIQLLTPNTNGWDVVFATKSGEKLGYYLHVFVE